MVKITPTKRGFKVERTPCVVCGEPPFGDEYCCGHTQFLPQRIKATYKGAVLGCFDDAIQAHNAIE